MQRSSIPPAASAPPASERAKPLSPIIETLEPRRLLSLSPLPLALAVPFEHIVIDQNPGTLPVVKVLADLSGTGHEDAIVGHSGDRGYGNLDWYQFPASGNPNDPWIKHTIDPYADVYEAIVPANVSGHLDSHGKPVNDLIVCEHGTIVWYENPLGDGADPTTAVWIRHVIGTLQEGLSHELYVADIDGDGKLDVVTNNAIFFQNSPDSWTQTASPAFTRTQKGLSLFDSGAGLGAVDLAGTGERPNFNVGWWENPRDHGGDARSDTWVFHVIGPAYVNYSDGDGISYASLDVNGDGRMDLVTAGGELANSETGLLGGGLIWWEAPADRADGAWIEHVIDPNVQDVHNLRVADINGDGQQDLVVFEQDQSPLERLMIVYNVGGTGRSWQQQTLATTGGQNEWVGDITGNGNLSILNSPHGYYNDINPIELWLNVQAPISGTVFNDTAGNGSLSSADAGLAGQHVFLDLNHDGKWEPGEPASVTDAQGNYQFFNVAPGHYAVSLYIAPWQHQTYPGNGSAHSATVIAGSDTNYIDFGVAAGPPSGSISGFVFVDANGDRQPNTSANEAPIPGQHVWLDLNRDGVWEPGEPAAVTDNTGSYRFNALNAGTYVVRYYCPPGFHQTFPTDYGSQPVTVAAGAVNGIDFGVAGGAIGIFGAVFDDLNANGTQDPGEYDIENQHVYIDLQHDGHYDPGDPVAITDSSGNYAFTGLADGTYVVRYFAPPGFRQTTSNGGSVTLSLHGEPIVNVNFGVAPL